MNPRLRKLVGSIMLLVGLGLYLLLAIAISQGAILEANAFLQFAFFLAAGLLWVPPAAWLIKWMLSDTRD